MVAYYEHPEGTSTTATLHVHYASCSCCSTGGTIVIQSRDINMKPVTVVERPRAASPPDYMQPKFSRKFVARRDQNWVAALRSFH